MYSYILLSTLPNEGMWISGVVHSLDEALDYFKTKKTKRMNLFNSREEELVQRALDDNWGSEDYDFSYWVEVWDKTKKICTYKYNTKTQLLDNFS